MSFECRLGQGHRNGL